MRRALPRSSAGKKSTEKNKKENKRPPQTGFAAVVCLYDIGYIELKSFDRMGNFFQKSIVIVVYYGISKCKL